MMNITAPIIPVMNPATNPCPIPLAIKPVTTPVIKAPITGTKPIKK